MEAGNTQKKPLHPMMFEIALLMGLLAAGFWLVPAMVYVTGDAVLGPYGSDLTMSRFYLDLFGMLVQGNKLAWLLLSAPYLTLMMLRALIWIWRSLNRSLSKTSTPSADN